MQDEIDNLQQQLRKIQRMKTTSHKQSQHNNDISRLKNDILIMNKNKEELEEQIKSYVSALNERNEIIKQLKSENERKLQKILREARRENSRSVSEMQALKKSLQEKEVEINKLEDYASKLNEEKYQLETDTLNASEVFENFGQILKLLTKILKITNLQKLNLTKVPIHENF